jgi:hypothetical protein
MSQFFTTSGGGGGSGDVVGPASATDNAVVRFDSTTGKLIQNSGVILDDSDNMTGVTSLVIDGSTGTVLTVDTDTLIVDADGDAVGIGQGSPSASLHIQAGTAAASTAPIKLTAGTNLTSPEAGAIEFDGTNLYFTDSTPTRQTIAVLGSGSTNVTSAGSSTDNAIARWDGASGDVIQDSSVIIDDTDNVTGIVDMTTTGYVNLADGAFNDPIIRFTSDPDTGIARASSNSMALIAGGGTRMWVTSTGLQANTNITAGSTGRFYLNNNSPSNTAPNYSFVNDTNTGMYRSNVDELSFTTGGTQAAYFDSSQVFTLTNALTVPNGGTGAGTFTDGGILLGSGTSAFTATSQPTNGQVLIGSTGVDPVLSTLTAGTGISIVNAAGSITINSTVTGGITWNEETGTSATMAVNNGYIANNAALVTLTMPSTAAVGDVVRVTGKGAGGWRIAQNASQVIHFGSSDTTTGATGRLDSTATYDSVEMVCITANTDFVVLSSIGNPTVT